MASARRFSIFILTIAVLCLGFGVCQINHLRGNNLTLKCNSPGVAESITWKYGNDKIVEWSLVNPPEPPEWFKTQGFSGILNINTGDVQLYNIQNGGRFTCEVQISSIVKSNSQNVVVWDKPSKPKVTCKRNETQITLHCAVNAEENVKWTGPNGFKATGETLVFKDLDETSIFFCSAENPATKTVTEFNFQDCEDLRTVGSNAGTVIGIVITIVILFLLAVVAYWKREHLVSICKQKSSAPRDNERQDAAPGNDTNQAHLLSQK